MNESPDIVYGRLKESAHLSGYTFARTTEWLESLLADDSWQQVGPGFTDVNIFLRSIDLSPFDLSENRPSLVRRIKDLQPDASVRAIADALGESKSQVQRDLHPPVPDGTPPPSDPLPDLEELSPPVPNGTPAQPPSPAVPEYDPNFGDDEEWDENEEDKEAEGESAPEVPTEPQAPAGAHVGKNTGDNEWYTPEPYIMAARAVMGGIDLDPASSPEANEVVKAELYYTEDDDGLSQAWAGRVWMNPPYAQPAVDRFCTRLAREYKDGSVTEACVLVNNGTETNYFQEVSGHASAVCFPRGRVKFWHPAKDAVPLQGQAVIYLGPHVAEFRAEFLRFGECWWRSLWLTSETGESLCGAAGIGRGAATNGAFRVAVSSLT